MNIYLVVEGKTEKKVYAKWAQIVNPNLQIVNDIGDVSNNHLYIISGGGYPSYFDVIEAGVNDVEENDAFDRLVVAVDSEQMSYREKHAELTDCILELNTNIDFRIVVQHFCLETWALGNRLIVSRHPQSKKLRDYIHFFNVVQNDPELMPGFLPEGLNRAQFAFKYLRTAINEKYTKLNYSKNNPKVLLSQKYFKQVKSRFIQTGHISSFENFLRAFRN